MTDEPISRFDLLVERASSANGSEEIRAVLAEVSSALQGGLDADTVGLLARHLLGLLTQLKEAAAGQPVQASDAILEYVLPPLLRGSWTTGDARFARLQLQELLVDWIEQSAEPDVDRLRGAVLDALRAALSTPAHVGAVWALRAIGYRRDDIVAALFALAAQRTDEAGDPALSALSSLGLEGRDLDRLRAEVHRRALASDSVPMWGALLRVADRSTIPILVSHWLDDYSDGSESDRPERGLLVLAEIAGRYVGDPAVQQEVWAVVARAIRARDSQAAASFAMSSQVAPRLGVPDVIPELVHLAYATDGTSDHQRYVVQLRAHECVRPVHVGGWERVVLDERALTRLRDDAVRDTGERGRYASAPAWNKETAWATALLYLDLPAAREWVDAALEHETSPFVQQHVLEHLANSRLDPLPESVRRWVTERFDDAADPDRTAWAPRLASIAVARSAASREAFDVLSRPGFLIGGALPQATASALSDVTRSLVGSDPAIIDSVVGMISEGGHARTLALYALSGLAHAGVLPARALPHVESILFTDATRDDQGTALSVLIEDGAALSPVVRDALPRWAAADDGPLAWQAALALADSGQLLDEQGLMGACGIARTDHGWAYVPGTARASWAPALVGALYANRPQEFEAVVSQILLQGDWHAAHPLLHALRRVHPSANGPLPPAVTDALRKRMVDQLGEFSAELDLFDHADALAPDLLLERQWVVLLHLWMPQARAAFANALGRSASAARSDAAAPALRRLASDGHFAVRRAAYRAMARVAPSLLYDLCFEWSVGSTELRKRAAEAWGWLRAAEVDRGRFACDRERAVREAFSRADEDRKRRGWATEHLNTVLRVARMDGEHRLPYAAGEALKRVGDDDSRRVLTEALGAADFAPHVAHWLHGISEDIGKRWDKETRKWSDPWTEVGGAVSQGQGEMVVGADRFAVKYLLWHRVAAKHGEPTDWGGRIWSEDLFNRLDLDGPNPYLVLEDGRNGSVFVIRVGGGNATVLGIGDFPTVPRAAVADGV